MHKFCCYLSAIIGCFYLSNTDLIAQDRIGLRFDNYQGINTVFFNPSNSSTQALGWNLNLASAGAFISNNYGFLENSSIGNLFDKTVVSRPDIGEGNSVDLNQFVVLDFNFEDSKKWAEATAFITGPSLLANIGNHHFGAFINYRAHIAEQDLDEDLGYYTNRRLLVSDPINIDPIQISGAIWREIGGHYTYSHETSFGKISIGGNFKYLSGLDALNLETTSTLQLQRISLDEVEIFEPRLEVYGTTPTIDLDNLGSDIKGAGFGFDIGVSVIVEDYGNDYKFKAGLAVNDIGSITFDRNVEGHLFQSNISSVFNKQNYLQLDGLRDLVNRVSIDVMGDPNASLDPTINSFDVKLPMAVVVNADYKIRDQFYVGGLFAQRIPSKNVSLERSNSIAVFPRYESKWLGAALPLSLTNFSKMNIGLSLRLAYVTIGTDNLGTLLSQQELYSADVYISLQFFSWNEKGLFNGLFGSGKGGGEKCFEI